MSKCRSNSEIRSFFLLMSYRIIPQTENILYCSSVVHWQKDLSTSPVRYHYCIIGRGNFIFGNRAWHLKNLMNALYYNNM